MPTPRWGVLRYHPEQHRVIADQFPPYTKPPKRYVVLPCGRRSGKTELAKRKIVLEAMWPKPDIPDPRYFCGAPTYQQAKNLFWKDIKALLPRHFITGISESELRIETVIGSEIWVLGLDKPQRMEGIPWDGCVLDEYANMKADVLDAHVRPALADREGWIWLIGVPEGRNHYWEIAQKAQTDERYLYATWPSHGTGISDEEIANIERDLPERLKRQELYASFEEFAGRIYDSFDRRENVKEFERPRDVGSESLPWRLGMDFNVHPMTAVVGWQDADTVYVWQDYSVPSSNTEELGKQIKGDGYFPAIAYPDPTGMARKTSAGRDVTDHRILQNLGFRVRSHTRSPSRRARYNAMNTRLCSGDGRRRLLIHPRCKELIKCLDGQVYPEGRSEEHPHDELGHINAALGYWVEYEFPIRTATSIGEGGKF